MILVITFADGQDTGEMALGQSLFLGFQVSV